MTHIRYPQFIQVILSYSPVHILSCHILRLTPMPTVHRYHCSRSPMIHNSPFSHSPSLCTPSRLTVSPSPRFLSHNSEIDPNLHHPSTGSDDSLTFGPDPPSFTDLFDLCPPVAECDECPKTPKCAEGRGALFGLSVEQYGNSTYPGFRNRSTGEFR